MKKILFDNNKNVTANRIRTFRLRAGMTQNQLAAKMQTFGANLDQQMISRIESNSRFVTDYELALFSKALDVSPEDLLADFYETYGDSK